MNKQGSMLATAALGLALVQSLTAPAYAAELQVFAGGAMTEPLTEFANRYKAATGQKFVFRFGTTPELIKLATTGGPFDLATVPREVLRDPAALARFAAGEAFINYLRTPAAVDLIKAKGMSPG